MIILKIDKEIKLPPEIVRLIILRINDSKTYLNARIVCKHWYSILSDIKTFENNVLKYITKINFNNITTYNLSDNIIKKIDFKKFGDYEITYFKNNVINKKLIHKAPNLIEENYFKNGLCLKRITYNHKNKSVVENNYNVCVIS